MPDNQVGTQTGIVIFSGTVGMAIGGWLGGFSYDFANSYEPAFLIGVAFNVINLGIIALLLVRSARHKLT